MKYAVHQIWAAFQQLLNWQLWSEEWCFPVSASAKSLETVGKNIDDTLLLNPRDLTFPDGHSVDVKIRGYEFVAKPRGPSSWWVGINKMYFKGRVYLQDGSALMRGRYGPSPIIRTIQAIANIGIATFLIWKGPVLINQGLEFPWPVAGLVVGFTLWVVLILLGLAFMQSFRLQGYITHQANASARYKLQAFLPHVTIRVPSNKLP